jgi:molybdopterin synthase sulfur carrier subunit
MITFQISGHLTEFAGGQAEIVLDASPESVGQALDRLWLKHAGLRDRVLNERGEVRPHVNVFVNSQIVRRDRVLQTAIPGNAEICIMPAVSGGSESVSTFAAETRRPRERAGEGSSAPSLPLK